MTDGDSLYRESDLCWRDPLKIHDRCPRQMEAPVIKKATCAGVILWKSTGSGRAGTLPRFPVARRDESSARATGADGRSWNPEPNFELPPIPRMRYRYDS